MTPSAEVQAIRSDARARLNELVAVRELLLPDRDDPLVHVRIDGDRVRHPSRKGSPVATSVMTPAMTSTEYLLAELRAARGWQRLALAEVTETPVDQVARWDEHAVQRDLEKAA
jgi:hypothetical protein